MNMQYASLTAIISKALTEQSNTNLSAEQIRQMVTEIVQRIEVQEELQNAPMAYLQSSVQPAIQIVLAHEHSSISDAAQNVIQVLVTQYSDSPGCLIPSEHRSPGACPYPGLKAFSEEESVLYHGRELETERFIQRLPQRLVAVTGASGVGKSSFVQAGIVPRLRQSYGEKATVVLFRASSTGSFLAEFAAALCRKFGGSVQDMQRTLELNERALQDYLKPWCAEPSRPVFIVVDQFEEIFVHETAAAYRRSFLDNLLVASSSPDLKALTIILVSRKNYFEHPDYIARPGLIQVLERDSANLDTLTGEQLHLAIEQPLISFNTLHHQNVRFQTGLVDVIVHDFRNLAISLPLVQYLLRLLWIEKNELTHSAYAALGKLDRVLDRHATDIYDTFVDTVKPAVDGILLSLVGLGLEGEYTRKRIRYDEIVRTIEDEAVVRRLSAPVSRIVSEQTISGIEYLELTHEVILREWALLRALISINRERLRQREQLLVSADLWMDSRSPARPQGDSGYLYQGALYRQARQYVSTTQPLIGADHRITECFSASERNRQRTILTTLSALAAVAMLVIILFWLQQQRLLDEQERVLVERQRADTNATAQAVAQHEAVVNATAQAVAEEQARMSENARATAAAQAMAEQEAKERQSLLALSRRLAAGADAALGTMQVDLALLLSVEAYRISPTVEAKISLFSSLENYPKIQKYLRHPQPGDPVIPLRFDPGSNLLAAGEPDGSVSLWDTTSGRFVDHLLPQTLLAPNDHYHASARSLVFVEDGNGLIYLDKFATWWDLSSGQRLEQRDLADFVALSASDTVAFPPAVAISSNGNYFAIARPEARTVEIIRNDAGEPTVVTTLSNDNGQFLWDGVTALAFNDDGSNLAIAMGDTSTGGVASGHLLLWDVERRQNLTKTVEIAVTSNLRYIDCLAINSNEVFAAYAPVAQFIAANPGESPDEFLRDGSLSRDTDRFVVGDYYDTMADLTYESPETDIFSSGCGLAISPNGTYFASGNLVLWNLTNTSHLNKTLALHPAHNLYDTQNAELLPTALLEFSHDSTQLLAIGWAARDDGRVYTSYKAKYAWDIRTGEPAQRQKSVTDFVGWMQEEDHESATNTLIDERQSVQYTALQAPNRLEIRDIETGQLIGTIPGIRARYLVLSPDGRYLASFGYPSHSLLPYPAHLTVVDFEMWQETACAIANRNLTQDEWSQYLPEQPYRLTCALE